MDVSALQGTAMSQWRSTTTTCLRRPCRQPCCARVGPSTCRAHTHPGRRAGTADVHERAARALQWWSSHWHAATRRGSRGVAVPRRGCDARAAAGLGADHVPLSTDAPVLMLCMTSCRCAGGRRGLGAAVCGRQRPVPPTPGACMHPARRHMPQEPGDCASPVVSIDAAWLLSTFLPRTIA